MSDYVPHIRFTHEVNWFRQAGYDRILEKESIFPLRREGPYRPITLYDGMTYYSQQVVTRGHLTLEHFEIRNNSLKLDLLSGLFCLSNEVNGRYIAAIGPFSSHKVHVYAHPIYQDQVCSYQWCSVQATLHNVCQDIAKLFGTFNYMRSQKMCVRWHGNGYFLNILRPMVLTGSLCWSRVCEVVPLTPGDDRRMMKQVNLVVAALLARSRVDIAPAWGMVEDGRNIPDERIDCYLPVGYNDNVRYLLRKGLEGDIDANILADKWYLAPYPGDNAVIDRLGVPEPLSRDLEYFDLHEDIDEVTMPNRSPFDHQPIGNGLTNEATVVPMPSGRFPSDTGYSETSTRNENMG